MLSGACPVQRVADLSGLHDKGIGGIGVAQHIAGDLFDKIGVRRILIEESDVASEFRPHGLEAPDLELQQSRAIEQLGACLEAVPAMDRMVGEIGCQTEAGKQNKDLRQPRPPY